MLRLAVQPSCAKTATVLAYFSSTTSMEHVSGFAILCFFLVFVWLMLPARGEFGSSGMIPSPEKRSDLSAHALS
eukprot:5930642-Amphidinium_carterae.1